jgi:uncharacterized protein (DUF58 family)
LLGLTLAWIAGALAAVGLPGLRGVLVGAAAALVLAALVDVLRLHRRPRVTVTRRLPERAVVGHPVSVALDFANPGATSVTVTALDEAPEDLVDTEPELVAAVAPGSTRTVTYPGRATQRGDRRFGAVHVFEPSPLGLWRRRAAYESGAVLAVFPDTAALVGRHALDPRRVQALLGVRPIRQRGEGMEFESLREYVPGDDPRRIDWNATVRRRRLVTRRYRHERNHTVVIAVDASRLMGARVGERTKLDHAIDAALAVAHAALTAGDRVGLALFDASVRAYLPPRGHRHRFGAFVEVLRTACPTLGEVDYGALVRRLALHQRQRALVVVLTDLIEGDDAHLEPLAILARRHRVLVVAIRDPVFEALAPQAPRPDEPALALYRRLALDELLRAREVALGRLRRAGVDAVDLVPQRLTPGVLNRYLPLRERAA